MSTATIKPVTTQPKISQVDNRINFLLARHFPLNPERRTFLENLAQLDPTPTKKYLAWLLKHSLAGWRPSKASCERIFRQLLVFERACKLAQNPTPLALRLLDLSFQPDIFKFTPQTFSRMIHAADRLIAKQDEVRRISTGEIVLCSGAEIAYQDDQFTVIRIRTAGALNKLSRAGSWCTSNMTFWRQDHYCLPFDLIYEKGGNRFLTDGWEIKDRWDKDVDSKKESILRELVKRSKDGFDIASEQLATASTTGQRLEIESETALLRYPSLAAEYAAKVLKREWPEFEANVKLNRLSSYAALEYAIHGKKERWVRAEKVINRVDDCHKNYAKHFGLEMPARLKPKANQSKRDKLNEILNRRLIHATENSRDSELEQALLSRPNFLAEYAREVAKKATSQPTDEYRAKVRSYFQHDGKEDAWQNQFAIAFLSHCTERLYFIEPLLHDRAHWALTYAINAVKRRFPAGEPAIMSNAECAATYAEKLIKDRWFAAEPTIRRDKEAWNRYRKSFRIAF